MMPELWLKIKDYKRKEQLWANLRLTFHIQVRWPRWVDLQRHHVNLKNIWPWTNFINGLILLLTSFQRWQNWNKLEQQQRIVQSWVFIWATKIIILRRRKFSWVSFYNKKFLFNNCYGVQIVVSTQGSGSHQPLVDISSTKFYKLTLIQTMKSNQACHTMLMIWEDFLNSIGKSVLASNLARWIFKNSGILFSMQIQMDIPTVIPMIECGERIGLLFRIHFALVLILTVNSPSVI